jgi:CRISPR type III-A-associated RAMP protein Csm4
MLQFNTHALLLKCRPGSQFHFGTPPLDEQSVVDKTALVLHSDTLYSALIDICSRIFPEFTENLIERFRSGDLIFSSASYFIDWKSGAQTERLFFFPKPVTLNLGEEKTSRKVAFISKGIWEQGILPTSKSWEIFGKFAMLKSEIPDHWPDQSNDFEFIELLTIPKVAIHKISKENSIYFQNNLVTPRYQALEKSAAQNFSDDAEMEENLLFKTHFFVLLKCSTVFEESLDFLKIKLLLEWLKDSGVGGERSVGCGRLENIEWANFEVNVSSQGHAASLLSLCQPADATELSLFSFFKTLTRGGRTTGFSRDLILGRVKMIAEGAILTDGGEPMGRLIELEKSPNHSIFRVGKAFIVPLHENFATDKWMN